MMCAQTKPETKSNKQTNAMPIHTPACQNQKQQHNKHKQHNNTPNNTHMQTPHIPMTKSKT